MNQEKEKGMEEGLEEVVQSMTLMDDLSNLTEEQRWEYYKKVCETYGLDPVTRPFSYIRFEDSGKLKLYALRSATDQLRKIHDISVSIVRQENFNGLVYIMTARAKDTKGRIDEAVGSVPLCDRYGNYLSPHDISNAIMTCQTKAIRRATLSICGVSMLDETEVLDIPNTNTKEASPAEPLATNVTTEKQEVKLEDSTEPPLLNQEGEETYNARVDNEFPSENVKPTLEWFAGRGVITKIERFEGQDQKPYHVLRIEEILPNEQKSFHDAYAVQQLSQAIDNRYFFECAEVEFKAKQTKKGLLLHSLVLVEQPQMNF